MHTQQKEKSASSVALKDNCSVQLTERATLSRLASRRVSTSVATDVETLLDANLERVALSVSCTEQLSFRATELADFSFCCVCTACPAVKLHAAEFG